MYTQALNTSDADISGVEDTARAQDFQARIDADAFTARILLIHHYRRVVLRDPLLPLALLPRDWPGRAARGLCGEIYRALLSPSEQWLDRHGSSENGPLPKAAAELARRFGDEPNVLQK